jgi:hypothetical protein
VSDDDFLLKAELFIGVQVAASDDFWILSFLSSEEA